MLFGCEDDVIIKQTDNTQESQKCFSFFKSHSVTPGRSFSTLGVAIPVLFCRRF